MLDAGTMDRRITIEALTVSQDAYGGTTESWATLATVWARWLPGGGNERFVAAAVYSETQGRFRIRWRSDVTTTHRVVWGGDNYDILAIDEIGRREGLELKVKKVV